MKSSLILIIMFFSLNSHAQWSFWGSLLTTCNSGSHKENGKCVSNIQNCSVSNGSGTQTWNGSSYGTCMVSSCTAGFLNISNSCVMAAASCQDHLNYGRSSSGVYRIVRDGNDFNAYCDQQTRGGGWMLVKRIIPTSSSTPGWTNKLTRTTTIGTLGSTVNYGSDYNLADSLYIGTISRHLVYRYTDSPSYSTSNVWDFNLSTSFASYGTTNWVNLSDLRINGSSATGTYRNQLALHISYGMCNVGSGSNEGGGEMGFCRAGDSYANSGWGSSTFNSAGTSSANRMITGLSYWNSALGFMVFVK